MILWSKNGSFLNKFNTLIKGVFSFSNAAPTTTPTPTPTPTPPPAPPNNHTGSDGGVSVVVKIADKTYLKVQRAILLQEEDDLMEILQMVLLSGILDGD